jgi:hypothetical protein
MFLVLCLSSVLLPLLASAAAFAIESKLLFDCD